MAKPKASAPRKKWQEQTLWGSPQTRCSLPKVLKTALFHKIGRAQKKSLSVKSLKSRSQRTTDNKSGNHLHWCSGSDRRSQHASVDWSVRDTEDYRGWCKNQNNIRGLGTKPEEMLPTSWYSEWNSPHLGEEGLALTPQYHTTLWALCSIVTLIQVRLFSRTTIILV